jgi:uncharacterized membrane protein
MLKSYLVLSQSKALNTISGLAEIILGVALVIPSLTSIAAWEL